jgi:hypothetical protein
MNADSRRHIALVCLGVAGLLSATAPAARAEPASGEGVGTYSCGEYTAATRGTPSREALYFSWAQGWMTGWNMAQMDVSRPTADLKSRSMEDEQVFLRTYCQLHPKALYMAAVYRLYFSIKPAK